VHLECKREREREREREDLEDDRLGGDDEHGVVCAACRAPITRTAFAIVMDGQHQHTFFNPAGIAYEIACFSAASGCDRVGQPTSEFAWFAGYRWSYALCRSCGEFLGWCFIGPRDGFWGLITSRIAESHQSRSGS
jgi:hypothetical protein